MTAIMIFGFVFVFAGMVSGASAKEDEVGLYTNSTRTVLLLTIGVILIAIGACGGIA